MTRFLQKGSLEGIFLLVIRLSCSFLQRLVNTLGEDCVVALEFRFALDESFSGHLYNNKLDAQIVLPGNKLDTQILLLVRICIS